MECGVDASARKMEHRGISMVAGKIKSCSMEHWSRSGGSAVRAHFKLTVRDRRIARSLGLHVPGRMHTGKSW